MCVSGMVGPSNADVAFAAQKSLLSTKKVVLSSSQIIYGSHGENTMLKERTRWDSIGYVQTQADTGNVVTQEYLGGAMLHMCSVRNP